MLYGVSSAIELDVKEFIVSAAATFTAIELVSEFPHVHYSTPNVNLLSELKRSYDLTYTMHAPFCGVNLASINPKLRNASLYEILNSITYPSELGCELIVVHPVSSAIREAYKNSSELQRKMKETLFAHM